MCMHIRYYATFDVLFTACKSGYFGPNCGKTCPYPLYGRKCVDGECNCPRHKCDVASGCIVGTRKIKQYRMNIPKFF